MYVIRGMNNKFRLIMFLVCIYIMHIYFHRVSYKKEPSWISFAKSTLINFNIAYHNVCNLGIFNVCIPLTNICFLV